MNIVLCHFRVKNIDGVSLEMEKWRTVLKQLGHIVYFIAGNSSKNVLTIEELKYNHPRNNKIVKNAYQHFSDYGSEKIFKNEIYTYASAIENKLTNYLKAYKIDVVIPSNIFSLGWNLSAAIGFYNACIKQKTRIICHHHDFWWERKKYSKPTKGFIQDILDEYLPPKHPLFSHILINKIAQDSLLEKKNIMGSIIPNVFNVKSPLWKKDEYSKDFRKEIGIQKEVIIFLQATRIVERKGIELAIDIVAEINKKKEQFINRQLYNGIKFTKKSNIYLVFSILKESPIYYEKLQQYADEKKVNILDINSRINAKRNQTNKKNYSFDDAYVFADMMTYPSLLEGWGNQFLEAIFAQKPIITYEYPVFKTDIKSFGFHIISLGDKHQRKSNGLVKIDTKILQKAAEESILNLFDNYYREKNISKNFNIASQNFSYHTLRQKLKKYYIKNNE